MSVLVYVLNFLLLGALVWAMYRQAWARSLGPYFFPALAFKMVCGVLLGLLYSRYYDGGDTMLYHQESTLAADILREQGLVPYMRYFFLDEVSSATLAAYRTAHYMGAWNVIKLFSLPNLLANGHYYLMALYLALFSFSGMGYLVHQLNRRYPEATFSAVLAFMFFPSVVFWSSGLLKESLLMGGIGYMVGAAIAIAAPEKGRRLASLLLLLGSLYLVWFVKYFIAAAMGASYIVGTLFQLIFKSGKFSKVPIAAKAVLLSGLLLLTFWFASGLDYNLQIGRLPSVVVGNYHIYLLDSIHKPHVEFPALQPSYLSLLLHAPLAVLYILFRPFPWEASTLIHGLAAAENIALLLLTGWCLYSCARQRRLRIDWFIAGSWVFVLGLAVLLPYSMPNLGTLNRYRIVFLPFYIYLLALNPAIASALHQVHIKLTSK